MMMMRHRQGPRESLRSLMPMFNPIGGWDMMSRRLSHVMALPVPVMMMILIVRTSIVIILLLRDLPLGVFFVFHPPVLEPNFHLAFREVQISRQFPPFLFGDVGVEEEFFLEFQRLEFRVGLALLANGHLAGPLERVGAGRAPARKSGAYAHAAQATCT